MNAQEKAKAKIFLILPHLRYAIAGAKSEGTKAQIGILATKPDGSGRIVAQFQADEFVDDLCVALGAATKNTEEEDLEVKAVQIVQRMQGEGKL